MYVQHSLVALNLNFDIMVLKQRFGLFLLRHKGRWILPTFLLYVGVISKVEILTIYDLQFSK